MSATLLVELLTEKNCALAVAGETCRAAVASLPIASLSASAEARASASSDSESSQPSRIARSASGSMIRDSRSITASDTR